MPGADPSRGEFALIARFFAGLDHGPDVALGNGDDAALLSLLPGEALAVSVDTMVDGRHFPPNSPAADLSYRAVAAAASDLAAMGARPLGMTLALTLPAADESWLTECRRGLQQAVRELQLPLVGGDLTRGPLTLSVQVFGAVPAGEALRRDGARPGDRLCVSGMLGESAAGLALLQGEESAPLAVTERLIVRFWRPQPALELGQRLRGQASAAIDVSDGLLADAAHIAEASGVAIHIDSNLLPVPELLIDSFGSARALAWALSGGEDYVLCFTLPEGPDLPSGCTVIGRVETGSGLYCDQQLAQAGYRHF